jgi:hypothetical protein
VKLVPNVWQDCTGLRSPKARAFAHQATTCLSELGPTRVDDDWQELAEAADEDEDEPEEVTRI